MAPFVFPPSHARKGAMVLMLMFGSLLVSELIILGFWTNYSMEMLWSSRRGLRRGSGVCGCDGCFGQ